MEFIGKGEVLLKAEGGLVRLKEVSISKTCGEFSFGNKSDVKPQSQTSLLFKRGKTDYISHVTSVNVTVNPDLIFNRLGTCPGCARLELFDRRRPS